MDEQQKHKLAAVHAELDKMAERVNEMQAEINRYELLMKYREKRVSRAEFLDRAAIQIGVELYKSKYGGADTEPFPSDDNYAYYWKRWAKESYRLAGILMKESKSKRFENLQI